MVENITLESEKWVVEFLSENPCKVNLLKRTKIWRIENYMKFIGTLNLGSFSIWCFDWLRGLSLSLIGWENWASLWLAKRTEPLSDWMRELSLFLIGEVITLIMIFSEVRSAVMGISPISGVRYDIQYHGWYERYFGAGLNNKNDSFEMSYIIWLILNESFSPMTQKFMCLSLQRKKTMPIENSKSSYVPVR